MPVDSFRFVSPGVFINEIDQSQVPSLGGLGSGPVVFGTAEKGPAMVPVTVRSFNEFVQIFGNPSPGVSGLSDIWREGDYSNPTYGAYAAQAYLANGSPLTFVRLIGDDSPSATGNGFGGWEVPQTVKYTEQGGAYGLFITSTGSNNPVGVDTMGEGMLAAIFYTTGSSTTISLSGTLQGNDTLDANLAAAVMNPVTGVLGQGASREFRVRISGSNGIDDTTFNFDPKSGRYIRKVFNTNPHLLNSAITPTQNLKDYFLGETFERSVIDSVDNVTRSNFSGSSAFIVALVTGSAWGGDFRKGHEIPATPWIVAQDLNTDVSQFDINNSVQRLFRVHSREGAEYAQGHYKISISDVKQSPNPNYQPYGTFTLMVRDMRDTDENPVIYEQYNNLDLNPMSNNFIGKRIGDRKPVYDTVNNKFVEEGQYPVQSALIRVELDETVELGNQDAALLPFGFRGIPAYRPFNIVSGSTFIQTYTLNAAPSGDRSESIVGNIAGTGSVPDDVIDIAANAGPQQVVFSGSTFTSASIIFPDIAMRLSSSDGRLAKSTKAFFGLSTVQSNGSQVFDGTTLDIVRTKPANLAAAATILAPGFSLDDLVSSGGNAYHDQQDLFVYYSQEAGTGNPLSPNSANIRRGTPQAAVGRRGGNSITAVTGSYTGVLDRGYDKFTVPMYGGFNGFDITEKDPFNNTRALAGTSKTETTSAPFFTLKKAIDSVGDVDQIDINMAVMPGITDTQTTDLLLAMAEERKDTLAIIDLEGGYTASTENTDSFTDRRGSSATTVTNVEDRDFNNSYGAAYYPWVQINDPAANARLWVPPSTIALGVMAASAARSELWFAPAGFNRGGLNNGSAGLNVVNVVEKLTADQRDDLYEVNVNPIASFPAEGIVVFGQKTLQATPSALDRINVRRLMIFLKKEVRKIANSILFDPNQQVTWNRFLNQVDPFLSSIKNRFGLSDYRVILDSSTTTPDLVDRNIMYAKILLKPTRAIEFIALDFVITRSGVEFE